MSTKTLKKLETAGENKKARHKAGLPTGAQFISDEKRYHADAETQVPLDSAKACAAKFCGRMGKQRRKNMFPALRRYSMR